MLSKLNKKEIYSFMFTFIVAFAILSGLSLATFDFSFTPTIQIVRKLAFLSMIIAIGEVIYEKKIAYFKSLILLFAIALAPVVIASKDYTPYYSLNTAIFALCITGICLLIVSFFSGLYQKIIAVLAATVVTFPTIVFVGYYLFSGEALKVETLSAIFETNLGEASEYLRAQLNPWHILVILVIISISALFVKFTNELKITNSKPTKIIATVLAILLIVPFCDTKILAKGDDGDYKYIYGSLYKNLQTHLQSFADFEAAAPKRKQNVKIFKDGEPGTYVLVIGESQLRTRLGAYGYERDTTPFLTSNLNNPNFIFFNKAYANFIHTAYSVTRALTAKNQYNDLKLADSPSITEIASWSGFEGHWISNQGEFGGNNLSMTQLAYACKNRYFAHAESDLDGYDEILLNKIPTQNLAPKTLIVIHLMGSHLIYNARYPQSFNKFGNGATNEYDNTIFYNDFIMREIFERVSKIPNFKALVYFSDHGEAPYEDERGQLLGHDSTKFRFDMAKIPFYMYFSDDYIAAHQDLISNLRSHKNDYFTNDLIFNVMNGIMAYDTNASRFKTLHGKRFLIEDNGTN